MKKILSLLVLLVALTSCEEDVRFNDPAFQAFKNNEIWKATNFTAVRNGDNSLTITAANGFETLVLKTESANPAQCEGVPFGNPNNPDRSGCQYLLGYDQINTASYVLEADGIIMAYQTSDDNIEGPGQEDGAILIYNRVKYTDFAQGFISGEFYFNAEDGEGNVVNFSQGVFYKIPIQVSP